MNKQTTAKLLVLNTKFYQKFASEFSNTRKSNWQGWEELFNYFEQINFKPHSILDLACGNGRFINTLNHYLGPSFTYLGIDNNQHLLTEAHKAYSDTNVTFSKQNIIEALNINAKYDLIVIFGFIHHLPPLILAQLLIQISTSLNKGGKLIFTSWNFTELKLYQTRLNSAQINKIQDLNLDATELGKNDYLLRWANSDTHARYCHNYTESEIQKILAKTKLKLEHSFKADGKNLRTNTYYVNSLV